MRLIWIVWVCLTLALPAAAQDRAQTLADIRQELSVLFVDIQRLRTELSTTGAPQVNTAGNTALDRINAIESELQRLTAQTEELEFRIEQIVADGTNRIGDLEFRLVELEGGDVSQLGETTTLGGSAGSSPATPVVSAPAQPETQMASQEAADFERAQSAFDEGDFVSAAAGFAAFNDTYPGGPLSVQADLRRGEALFNLGDTREGARAFLRAFSSDDTGPDAPEALYRLGAALGALGTVTEACVTLAEVVVRFPESDFATRALDEQRLLACG